MVKKTKTFNRAKTKLSKNKQIQTIFGLFLIAFSLFALLSFVSYLFHWESDQSQLTHWTNKDVTVENVFGKTGAVISHFFIFKGFGLASFYFAFLFFITGVYITLKINLSKIRKYWGWGLLSVVWISLFFASIKNLPTLFSGTVGYEINAYLKNFLGRGGVFLLLLFTLLSSIVILFKINVEEEIRLKWKLYKIRQREKKQIVKSDENKIRDDLNQIKEIELEKEIQQLGQANKLEEIELIKEIKKPEEVICENDFNTESIIDFDPTLNLGKYQFPLLNFLTDFDESISVNSEELEVNKNKIVQTLKHYNIGISQIKATVGPTITLYEIVPNAGIRISRIKSLEDDIALSLVALGIRIIAPIPGKGTIGIEVPNKTPSIVSIKSVLSSTKFQNAKMELPIAFGKNISNETFVVDLAKMPHLLMAGATGQGKSVCLNTILTSLLYKKHPAEVKFVLVDPKKVELTLFSKIERHYLAKLPDEQEAIITDTTKVINTLNSLCIEMDHRYDVLKEAMVRNIKEYNIKFKKRKLNPDLGHKFLPYIVLVIDEFADLIMTAGKEVETPIARLAQLARAVGIHLIIATQRPSVNVITGIIKANFSARIAFRVTSKIDSRTILDYPGANQLIGRGDMLYFGGNELQRLQCAFVDTTEVERITEFIGSQKAYPMAHLLPEYKSEESGTVIETDNTDRDQLFKQAALIIVNAQQGSASLLQRKLKLGYNRAGRLIDQLEDAGIVGAFEGSKAREVKVHSEAELDRLLHEDN